MSRISLYESFVVIVLFFCALLNYLRTNHNVSIGQEARSDFKCLQWRLGEKTYIRNTSKYITGINLPNIVQKVPITVKYDVGSIYPIRSYGELGNDAIIPSISEIKGNISNFEAFYMELKDVFVNHEGLFLYNDTFYPIDCDCHYTFCLRNHNSEEAFPSKFNYVQIDDLVVITHEYGYFFAHFMMDFFPNFLVMPPEILKKSKVLITHNAGFILDGLRILGFDINNVLYSSNGFAYYAKRLYTVLPIICTKFNYHLLLNMRHIMTQKYQFDKTPAVEFIIYNRVGGFRSIDNFEAVSNGIKQKYPQFPWKNIEIPHSLVDQFRMFNTFKVLVAMHGAALANSIFMQPGSGIVEVQVNRWVTNYLWLSSYAQLHHVVCRNSNVKWRDQSTNVLDVDVMIKTVEVLLKEMNLLS